MNLRHIATVAISFILMPMPLGAQTTSETPRNLPVVAAYEAPTQNIQDHFDATLGKFNNVLFGALFFDASFGIFQSDQTDDNGNPVYEQLPVWETELTQQAFTATLINNDGNPIIDAYGLASTVEIPAGSKIQTLENGKPVFENGAATQKGAKVPFLVLFLAFGAIAFTLYHRFINLRGFAHAIQIVRGKFSKSDDDGDVSPFKALTSALSATVGLGNIAGVALAMHAGGAGALFWMMVLGLFGMTAKFHESTLAQMFRTHNADGSISGGPMYYLRDGFKQHLPQFGWLGKTLAIIFAVFCLGASLGGGNMFQGNQSYNAFHTAFLDEAPLIEQVRKEADIAILREIVTTDSATTLTNEEIRALATPSQLSNLLTQLQIDQDKAQRSDLKTKASYGFGILLACLVGIVIVGGINRIGTATSAIVPLMAGIYVLACSVLLIMHAPAIPELIGQIFTEAFSWESAKGGLIGVLIIGFQRAAFSSESGLGSSAIAHSAAKQSEPVREGLVASIEPFIDTIVICFMTGMTVLITQAHLSGEDGAAITMTAFESVPALAGWFPSVLSISIILFAFSTMISWCYYGERAWIYLFNEKTLIVYRFIFVIATFVGCVASLGPVLDFSDVMLLSMALPNILGGVLLAPLVKRKLQDYWKRLKSGEFDSAA